MRSLLLILGLALTGCATTSPPPETAERPFGLQYDPSASAALAFDPPIAMNVVMPDFSRDGRAMEAFAGYEQQITTFGYTHQRDEVRVQGAYGYFDRQAYTDRTSVITR